MHGRIQQWNPPGHCAGGILRRAWRALLAAIAKFVRNEGDRLFIFPCQNAPRNVDNFAAGIREATTMSKMNFAYNPPEAAKTEVRLPLLSLGYVVLAIALVWMIARPYIGV